LKKAMGPGAFQFEYKSNMVPRFGEFVSARFEKAEVLRNVALVSTWPNSPTEPKVEFKFVFERGDEDA